MAGPSTSRSRSRSRGRGLLALVPLLVLASSGPAGAPYSLTTARALP